MSPSTVFRSAFCNPVSEQEPMNFSVFSGNLSVVIPTGMLLTMLQQSTVQITNPDMDLRVPAMWSIGSLTAPEPIADLDLAPSDIAFSDLVSAARAMTGGDTSHMLDI